MSTLKIEFLQLFEKHLKYKISRKTRTVQAELFHADGQTWRKANSRSSQFCEKRLKIPPELHLQRQCTYVPSKQDLYDKQLNARFA